jgi:signal peptidase I
MVVMKKISRDGKKKHPVVVFVLRTFLFFIILTALVLIYFRYHEEAYNIPFEIRLESGIDRPSPHNVIGINDIDVREDEVRIKMPWAIVYSIENTKSMDPVLDYGSYGLGISPQTADDLHIGDIVTYRSNYHEKPIIHRIIAVGMDTSGWYAKLKGDNNLLEDPGRIRFGQINRIVIAVLY